MISWVKLDLYVISPFFFLLFLCFVVYASRPLLMLLRFNLFFLCIKEKRERELRCKWDN
jgi:hypothetical protein